jgi:hypothetical protein
MAQEPVEQPPLKPWWREPWPWILMAGPAVTVVGCLVTLALALNSPGGQALHAGGGEAAATAHK